MNTSVEEGLRVTVTVEPLAPCKKLVRVEVETKSVDEAFETITKEFQRQASFPGFRPGKAPREMVLRKYEADIQDEVKRKLISQAYKKAVEEQNLEVIGQPDIEEVQFSRGQPLQFNANVETAPEFELPEYRGLLVKMEARTLTDADVDRALEALREPKAGFQKMDRAVQTGDVAVVNYTGTCEGKPITEIAPTAQGLTAKNNFWVEIPSKSFLPGFGDQLIGAKAGEKRTVTVDFPADFVTPQLAGKQGVYEVEVIEVKEKVLPPVDDNLAKAYGAEDLAKLRDGVRKDLENEVSYNRKKSARDQVVRGLLDRVNFELPESAVGQETRQVVNNIVQDMARRGGSRADVERQKEQIFSAAVQGAKERVKLTFLLRKIAEKEDIKVSEAEIGQRVQQLAGLYRIPLDQFVKELQQRGGLIEVYDQLMNEKVIDLLQQNARLEEVPAPSGPEANPS